MSTSPYNQYTGSKPPPLWLKVGGTIAMIFVMLGYVSWGFIKLAGSRPLRGGE
jgi:hypothetical protein